MKEKTILKIIKDDFELNTPNVFSKINLKNIIIEPAKPVIKKRFNFNIFSQISLVTAALVIGLFMGILLTKPTNLLTSPDIITVTSKDTTVASYVTSGLNLVSLNTSSNVNMSMLSQPEPVKPANIDTFHENIGIFEEYLNLHTNNVSIISNHMERSMSDYDYKMVIQNKSILGKSTSYILYYNEEREVDGDEEEKEMTGILLVDDVTFNFKVEVELEKDESELKVTMYNDDFKVIVKKEVEKDEYIYQYKVYEGKNIIKELEFSVEDKEIILEVKEGNTKTEFYIKEVGHLTYLVTLGDDEDDASFTLIIDIKNNNYKYKFNNSEIDKKEV